MQIPRLSSCSMTQSAMSSNFSMQLNFIADSTQSSQRNLQNVTENKTRQRKIDDELGAFTQQHEERIASKRNSIAKNKQDEIHGRFCFPLARPFFPPLTGMHGNRQVKGNHGAVYSKSKKLFRRFLRREIVSQFNGRRVHTFDRDQRR